MEEFGNCRPRKVVNADEVLKEEHNRHVTSTHCHEIFKQLKRRGGEQRIVEMSRPAADSA
jgi:hypothetical protein